MVKLANRWQACAQPASRLVWMVLQAPALVGPLQLLAFFGGREIAAETQDAVVVRVAPLRHMASCRCGCDDPTSGRTCRTWASMIPILTKYLAFTAGNMGIPSKRRPTFLPPNRSTLPAHSPGLARASRALLPPLWPPVRFAPHLVEPRPHRLNSLLIIFFRAGLFRAEADVTIPLRHLCHLVSSVSKLCSPLLLLLFQF